MKRKIFDFQREPRLIMLGKARVDSLRANMSPAIKNGLWNSVANGGVMLAGMLGSILIVRGLTQEEYGRLSYYLWLANTIGLLGTLALPNAVTKVTSELRGGQQEKEAWSLSRWVAQCLLVLNVLISLGVVLWTFDVPASQRIYLLIIAISPIPNALTAVLRSTLWGRELYKPVSLTIFMSSLFQLGLIIVSYTLNWQVPGFLAALLAINLVQAIGLMIGARSSFKRFLPISKSFILPESSVLRRYFEFALPATLVLFYEVIVWQRSEIFFLEKFSSLEEVGFYNLAYTVFGMMLTLGWALVHGFYPAISRDYGAGDWSHIHERVRQGLILAALFAVPLTFGGWAILNNITLLLYTSKMLPMVVVARVLLIGLLPGVITGLLSILVNAVGGIWLQVRLGLLMVVLSLSLNLILIPRFGALGAAVANTSAQLFYSACLAVIVQKRYQVRFPVRHIAGIVIAGVFTTFLVPTLAQVWLSGLAGVVGAVLSAAASYVAAILLLGRFQSLMTLKARP